MEIMRVFLIVCGVLVVNMFLQMARAAGSAAKPAPRQGRKEKPAERQPAPAAVLDTTPADGSAPVEAEPPAPKKRGRPRKDASAATPTPPPVKPRPAVVFAPIHAAPAAPDKGHTPAAPITPARAYAFGQTVTTRPYSLAEFANCLNP